MRTLIGTFAFSSLLALSAVQAQEPLAGNATPNSRARFEMTPGQRYVMLRAQAEVAHRDAIAHYYDWAGFDYAHPNTNAGMFFNTQPPFRYRKYLGYSNFWIDRY